MANYYTDNQGNAIDYEGRVFLRKTIDIFQNGMRVLPNWKDMVPEGVSIEIRQHDTATHCHVYLKMEGESSLLIWYYTAWKGSCYDANERNNVHGMQKDCDWASHIIADIRSAFSDELQRKEMLDRELATVAEKAVESRRESKIEKYRQKYALPGEKP